ncbi:hypothetical protein MTR67_040396 [Solanum verrucosum]|uniref:Uncharacterized protein n=1 Tax=Solanum verrucosum TaxID=315347 RepID=A0AAF0ZPR7_SOLVR|nr:hypothetical protein MTR67_040396 [Solanum verrucosum]
MLPDVLMISSEVQGSGPLQSMLVQGHMLYNWKVVCVRKLVKSPVYYTYQKRRGRGFTPLSKEVST